MKIRSTLPPLLIVLVTALLYTTPASSAIAPDQGSSAFGEGGFGLFNGVRTEQWGFSFDATSNKNGQARGRATFVNNSIQTQVIVKIDCLDVLPPTVGIINAIITGTVLHSDDPDFPKRTRVIFAAEDSSGFATVRADMITPLFAIPFTEGDCHDISQPLTMFPLSPDAITIEP